MYVNYVDGHDDDGDEIFFLLSRKVKEYSSIWGSGVPRSVLNLEP